MTYKLLIVDDFFVEREKVKELIAASGLGLDVIGEACDGTEALAMIECDPPDFVLTDIEMPFMNGLEFAQELRRRRPDIEIIFFTYYEKFEYVKKAIDLNAFSFIMKPIVEEEMADALRRIIERQEARRREDQERARLEGMLRESMPLLAQRFVRSWFAGLPVSEKEIADQLAFHALPEPDGPYAVLAAELDDPGARAADLPVAERELLLLRVSKIIETALDGTESLVCPMEGLRWGVAVFGGREFAAAEAIWSAAADAGLSLTIGISGRLDGLPRLAAGYAQAARALSHKFHLGQGQLISADEVEALEEGEDGKPQSLPGLLSELERVLLSGDAAGFVDRLMAQASVRSAQSIRGDCLAVVFGVQWLLGERNLDLTQRPGTSGLPWAELLRLETAADLRQWLATFLRDTAEWLADGAVHRAGAVVREAKRLIEAKYAEPLTVKCISEALHYSPNHLNHLFKQETGRTILEYLTHVRIRAAQGLLRDSNAKMYEITRLVGYGQESYFRSVFKQVTGLTPKEYRDKTRGHAE